MKVTVCEIHSAPAQFALQWPRLLAHLKESGSELLLLPEFPFYPWLYGTDHYIAEQWQAAEQAHLGFLQELKALPCAVVATRPLTENLQRYNRGFVTENNLYTEVHTKYYLPDEEGFWEATWYQPGDGKFTAFSAAKAECGLLICTDIWFLEQARHYGRAGAQLLLNPRANYPFDEDREIWRTATQAAAFSSGCWVLTSNLLPADAEENSAAQAWIISPDGELVAHTTAEQPFITVEIDLSAADAAKKRYPCYIKE
jgi:predicted amidohydrolase